MINQLENRRLLSSALSGGILNIISTTASDTINVSLSGTSIRVQENSTTKNFLASAVQRIVLDARSGNDRVTISTAITKPCSILGSSGNDTIQSGNGPDTVDGGDGNDVLRGGKGNDRIRGGNGVDAMFGNDGNDTLDGGAGKDYFDGGAGSDTADYRARTDALKFRFNLFYLNAYTSALTPSVGGAAGENDSIFGTETLFGGRGNDDISVIADYPAEDSYPPAIIDGYLGADTISLDAVYIAVLEEDVTVRGGDGNDRIIGTFPFGDIYGDAGDDYIYMDGYDVFHDGGSGNDRVKMLIDTRDDYEYRMGAGIENLDIDGPSHMRIYGNGLNNTIVAESAELIDGLAGNDRITLKEAGSTEFPDIVRGGAGNDTLTGNANPNILEGGDGDDVLYGGGGNDTLNGGAGRDALHGQAGNDRLLGGSGDDFLAGGGTEADYLDGGADRDTAVRDNADTRIAIEVLS